MKGKNRILTDALREVKNTRSRFLSLFLLSALAVAFLSGLRATAPDMQHSADLYFDASRTMDIHILSTLGISEDDVAALARRSDLDTVEGAYIVDALTPIEQGDLVVKTLSFQEGGLNQPTLHEGRMPQRGDECLLDVSLLGAGLSIGDTIPLDPGDGDMEGALRYERYTIVGTASTPLYISMERGSSTLGSGRVGAFLLLREDGYNLDAYTDLYATAAGAAELNAYGDEYADRMEQLTDELEEVGKTRAGLRYDSVIGEAQETLADARQELSDAEQEVREELSKAERELHDARRELNDGWRDYRQGRADFYAEIADAKQQIADGEQELRDAETELADARRTLEEGEEDYQAGIYEYQKGLSDYEMGKAALEQGRKEYEDGLAQYRAGASALAAGRQQLEESKAQLDAAQAQFDQLTGGLLMVLNRDQLLFPDADTLFAALSAPDAETTLWPGVEAVLGQLAIFAPPEADFPTTVPDLLAAKAQLDEGRAAYDSGLAQLNAGSAQLSAAWDQLYDAQRELEKGEKELSDALTELQKAEADMAQGRIDLDEGWAEYRDGLSDFEQGKRDLADARQELSDGMTEGEEELRDAYRKLTDGEAEYADGLQEYEDGKQEAETELADARQKLNDAERDLAEIEDCKWYVLDRDTNVGIVTFGQDADRMKNLATLFPLIFFLVAALVCLTTMTRMVEEQRVQIGGLKALGYSRLAIAFKYVGYGFFSGLLGGIVGLLLGRTAIPSIIYTAWCIIYELPTKVTFQPQPLSDLAAVAAAVAVLTLSALAASLSALTSVPAQLMRPKAPPAGKRVLLERVKPLWRRFSFNQKVTLRNLFRYKKRFIMTLVGISGCTALIVTGFGLRDSIFDIMDIQYGELTRYTTTLSVEDDMTPAERQEVVRVLDGSADLTDWMAASTTTVTAEKGRASLSLYVLSSDSPEDLARFNVFRDRISGESIPFGEESVLLSEKAAKMLGVGVGDSVTLVRDNERYEATVTGITEHYVQHYIYTTSTMYERIFHEPPDGNTYLLTLDGDSPGAADRVAEQLVSLSGVTGLSRMEAIRDSMQHSMETVDYAVVIIIVAAAALAFVVLFNLTNINITERLRELATLKVLGFYDKELSAYVYRENIILTVLGAVLGLFLGKALLLWLIGTVEIDMAMFGRRIAPLSYALAALLTCLFSLLVNLAAHHKLKKLDMVESLKTVE